MSLEQDSQFDTPKQNGLELELAPSRSGHAVPDLACNAGPLPGNRVSRCVSSSRSLLLLRLNKSGWLGTPHGVRGLTRASAVAVFQLVAERFVLDSTTDPVPKQFHPMWAVGGVFFDELIR